MRRVLLKVSGEGLAGGKISFDFSVINQLAQDISSLSKQGVHVAIVIGGGNLFRGAKNHKMERAKADHVGMLATMMNGLILQEALSDHDAPSHVMAPYPYTPCIESFCLIKAREYLDKERIVICTGGTGSPYFTTDTAAVLRALEFQCDVLLKGTNVDGVYNTDPLRNPNALHLKSLTFEEVIEKQYKVMDLTAFTLAKEGKLPIIVFSLFEKNSLLNIFNQKGQFSIIR
jgi:uridylate kinase